MLQADDALRQLLHERLQAFDLHAAGEHPHHAAAVAVAITEEGLGAELDGMEQHRHWSDRAALVLTRRAEHLRNHAGQWALPGGRIEADETPEDAALRELAEEVDLVLDPSSAILGRLDDYVTRSGFVITPVVVWAGAARAMRPNPSEVQSIHRIPIEEFGRADAPMLSSGPDAARPVLRMPVGTSWIAAPTAAVLLQFRELCLGGRVTRVAHFDQPEFAWR